MRHADAQKVFDLQTKVEGLIELELGRRVPFVCLIALDDHMGVFTNRRDDKEVVMMLKAAVKNISGQEGKRWLIEEGD